MWAFWLGYFYASKKIVYLEGYVAEENLIKAQQLAEAEVDPNNVRGHSFHAPKIYDPEFTEYQMSLRDRYPDYYLDPSDEFVYQTTRGKMKKTRSERTVAYRSSRLLVGLASSRIKRINS